MTQEIVPITSVQALEMNFQWFCVQKHLLSTRPDSNACLYRGPNGLRCGIGCLIPDALYFPEMDEGIETAIDDILGQDGEEAEKLLELFEHCSVNFLIALQQVHDALSKPGYDAKAVPEDYQAGLVALAKRFDIDWTLGVG